MSRQPWPALAGLVFGIAVVVGVGVWIFLLRPDGPPDPLPIADRGTFTCEAGTVVAAEADGTIHRWEDWEAEGAITALERGAVDLPPGVEIQAIRDWIATCIE